MSVDWERIASEWWRAQPHPLEPRLTIGDFPIAVKLATRARFGGHASPHEAAAHWQEFQSTNKRLAAQGKEPLSPEEYTHLLDQIAPVSFTYHGKPPSMHEIVALRDQSPKAIRDHYASLPDQHYPHVTAGEMVKSLESAKPWANEHLKRDPVKSEAAYLHHSGHHPQDYYAYLGQAQNPEQQQQQTEQTDAVPTPARRG